jgi:aspartyl-tRNA(Asn)/glutamyl-tRNA(Gln) amidotransferase subunit A
MKLNELTISEAVTGISEGRFTAVDLVTACLDRIDERNHELNAFITVRDREDVLRDAQKSDEKIASGNAGSLEGIPFGVKDAIVTIGLRSTGASKILDTYVPPYDATVIARLRSAGAILIGKQNCDAFGHGASNENSMYGPVKNPYDLSKVSGGSSGGSAAALADGMCLFSIAEDTGGSIRQPARFCGVVGLRPSYGRNSRYGIMPMASSLDTVGPMTRSVGDMALVMQVIAGHDDRDATTLSDTVPDYVGLHGSDVSSLRVGVPIEYMNMEGMSDEVRTRTTEMIDKLRDAGAQVVDVSLPYTKYAIPVYYLIVPSEDSSNLARLDGMRYGVRADGDTLASVYGNSREHGFPEEVKRRIMIGTYALSAGYYDAYYRQAQKVRTLIRDDFDRVFADVDVLITPTSPFTAFGLGEKDGDVMSMYLADVFVSPGALAGIPAISIPAGMSGAGLPVGIQVMGPRMSEALVMQVGRMLETYSKSEFL